MQPPWRALANRALDELTPEERQRGILYLDRALVPAGGTVEIDGKPLRVDRPTVVAFVDAEPAANWAHPCRYLLLDVKGESARSVPAQLPPFLRGAPPTLELVHRGDLAPEWAVATAPTAAGG